MKSKADNVSWDFLVLTSNFLVTVHTINNVTWIHGTKLVVKLYSEVPAVAFSELKPETKKKKNA